MKSNGSTQVRNMLLAVATLSFCEISTAHEGTAAPIREIVANQHGADRTTGRRVPRHTEKSRGTCMRPILRSNRLYRRSEGGIAHWNAEAMWNRALPEIPAQAQSRSDGVIVFDGQLYVPWQTSLGNGMLRVVREADSYRVKIDGGRGGPRVVRQSDNTWDLDRANLVEGSAVAALLPDNLVVDPLTIQRTARILELMGLPESRLGESFNAELPLARQALMLSLGQALLETLPTRLRHQQTTEWTSAEVRLVLPDVAAHIGRPIALYHADGSLAVSASSHGMVFRDGHVPADALRVIRYHDRLFATRGSEDQTYSSLFGAVEAATRLAGDRRARDPRVQESDFRQALARSIESRSVAARFDDILHYWIAPSRLTMAQRRSLDDIVRVTRLRQILFDRHHPLTDIEEQQLVQATRDLMPRGQEVAIDVVRHGTGALIARYESGSPTARIVIEADLDTTGRRIAYYQGAAPGGSPLRSRRIDDDSFSPIIDVLLNTDNGRIRKALTRTEWDFRGFADSLIARIADEENALLPPSLSRFVSRDPAILNDAETRREDTWLVNDRRFVRLRSLDGKTQIVETTLSPVNHGYELLNYPNSHGIAISRLTERHGKWYPSRILRHGFDPTSPRYRENAVARLAGTLPPGSMVSNDLLGRIVDTVPYPILLSYMAQQVKVQISTSGELQLVFGKGHVNIRRTGIYMPGAVAAAVPVAPPPPRPLTPLTAFRSHAETAPLRGATPHLPSIDSFNVFTALMNAGAPVGDFIQNGVGNRHIQALATARRLRTMLRSDQYIALVGTMDLHVFVVALPVNDESMRLLNQGGAYINEFPTGTRILDDWLNVAATADAYPLGARTAIHDMERQGPVEVTMRVGDDLATMSGTHFIDELLTSRVTFNSWNPPNDPITEPDYIQYVWRRYHQNLSAEPAGLDWLQTAAQRAEIARYFSQPPQARSSISSLEALAAAAAELGSSSAPGPSSAGEATTSLPRVLE